MINDTHRRPFVIVESPFAGDLERNSLYLRRCLRHSTIEKGELPFASHGFYPLFLDDTVSEEREFGMSAGYRFWNLAEMIVFYTDYGVSSGMERAVKRALDLNYPHEYRKIGVNK